MFNKVPCMTCLGTRSPLCAKPPDRLRTRTENDPRLPDYPPPRLAPDWTTSRICERTPANGQRQRTWISDFPPSPSNSPFPELLIKSLLNLILPGMDSALILFSLVATRITLEFATIYIKIYIAIWHENNCLEP